MNVVIIGMRGAGKSNVSRRLSVLTKRPVLSTDVLVEYDAGMSIPSFVGLRGWPAFREAEHEVLRKLTAIDAAIIDCGGGIVVDVDDAGEEVFSVRKVDLLRRLGPIIWLSGDIERLSRKAAGSATRPVLDERRTALELMNRRLPFYTDAADFVIDIEGRKRQEMAQQIAELVYGEWSDPEWPG
jgi:shikimate kinase